MSYLEVNDIFKRKLMIMPKYFDGERLLPFKKVTIDISSLTYEFLNQLISSNSSMSLCVRLPGFEETCLGYVFNVKKLGETFQIIDITERVVLSLKSIEEIDELIKHAIGYAYSESMHRELAKLRDAVN